MYDDILTIFLQYANTCTFRPLFFIIYYTKSTLQAKAAIILNS